MSESAASCGFVFMSVLLRVLPGGGRFIFSSL